MLLFSRPSESIYLNERVVEKIGNDVHNEWKFKYFELESDNYLGAEVELFGTEGKGFHFVRVGHKTEGPWSTLPVFFRLSDDIESYIKSQLTNGIIFQCNSSYAVWSDGIKTAKVIYDAYKKDELEKTLEIAKELSKTTIPHTKVIDYKIFPNIGSVLIMDYVGGDLEVLGLEDDPEISSQLDDLIF